MAQVSGSLWRALLAAVFLMVFPTVGPALDADEMFADPAQEARARDIGRQLRCLKCRNQSIFDSNAGIAKDLRVVVRERMVAGDSDEEIFTYVVERFGDYVLLKPRVSGQTYVLWMAPFFLVGLGGVTLWVYLRGRQSRMAPAVLSQADRAEAQRILKGGEI